MMKPHITYFEAGAWPIKFGFTTDPLAFEREQRRLGLESSDMAPFCGSGNFDGQTATFNCGGVKIVVVTLDVKRKMSRDQRIGVIVHEAVHVWEEVCNAMRGENPGGEVAAYAVQWITLCILSELK